MTDGQASRRAGLRGLRNTFVRSLAELAGKLGTLAVLAVLARAKGDAEVGALISAMAFLVLATMPIDLGLDRYMLRRIAADRSRYPAIVGEVLRAKAALAIPTVPLALAVLYVVHFDHAVRVTTLLLVASFVLDAFARTLQYAFTAVERAGLLARAVICQRIAATALGLALLAAGYGVRAVAVSMTLGSLVGLLVSARLARRELGRLDLRVAPRAASVVALIRASWAYVVQDVFTSLLFRLDALLLTLMTTAATVGRYGGAYRLLEATLFLSFSIAGAFSPMFTYLTPDSEPRVGVMFARSVKLALATLTPIAIVFTLRANETSALFYGGGFGAGPALALLGPVVVLLALATLGSSLTVSRSDPRIMVVLAGAATLINLAANLILIPSHGAAGAAAAMLVTTAFSAAGSMLVATRLTGEFGLAQTLAAPLAAGAAMALACALLPHGLGVTLPVAAAAYALVFVAIERIASPSDLRFAADVLRRRLA
jgi:O-antigen/teichoic acid export membrane protein